MNKLQEKKMIFLGSSVTYGSAAGGSSFVDCLVRKYDITPIKEAVSGTTLVEIERENLPSYIFRLRTIDNNFKADAFICQLSTNDAALNMPLGNVAEGKEIISFDTLTITGAMEYIIAYAKQTWNCPVLFFTGTYFDSINYQAMVDRLYELRKKWDIGIIDLWNNEEMRNVSKEDYAVYMADPVHPTRAGYEKWWLPQFEKELENLY